MKPGKVVVAFDRLAPRYDAWYGTPLGAFVDAREKEAVFALANLRPEQRALDVGCGTGNYTLELARRLEQGSRGAEETRRQGDREQDKGSPCHPLSLSPLLPCTPAPLPT